MRRVVLGCGVLLAFTSCAFAQTGEIEHDWTLKVGGDLYGLRQVVYPGAWRGTYVYFADDEILRSTLTAWQLVSLSLLAVTVIACGIIWVVCLFRQPSSRVAG